MNFWEQVCCVLSEELLFETFAPISYHLPPYRTMLTKTKKKKMAKSKIWNFVYFQRRCCFKIFLPYGYMLMKTKKNRKNKHKIKFEKQKQEAQGS